MFLALNRLNATGVRKFGKIHTLSRYSSETVGRSVIVTINDDRKSLSLIQNLRLDLKPEVELRRKRACAVIIWPKMGLNVVLSFMRYSVIGMRRANT